MEILKHTYKEHSHIPTRQIEKMQDRHRRDIIQPRYQGEVNPEYVKEYGTKNLNIDNHDIRQMWKQDAELARVLIKKRETQLKEQ